MTQRTFFTKPSVMYAIQSSIIILFFLSWAAPSSPQARKSSQSRQLQQTPPVTVLPSTAKRWALVIGIDDYEDTQITTLGGATNDARAVTGALVRYAGFPADQVILLASNQPTERQPTRGNILRKLSNLRGVVPKDGMLLVSFAGHGIERSNQAYLLSSDSQVSGDIRLLEETAINVSRMKEAIKETGVGQVILILDACRNDPIGRANADNPLTPTYTRGFNFDVRNKEVTAFVTLYATAVGQRAFEFKEKRQGYFTWELVEALSGKAADKAGEVTLANLIRYLQEHVPKHVMTDIGKDQRPFAIIEGYKADELVVAIVGQSPSGIEVLKQAVEAESAETALWEQLKNSNDAQSLRAFLIAYPNGQYVIQAKQRLSNLEAEANGALEILGSNSGIHISLASLAYMGPLSRSILGVYGTGWDGGSDIKVTINGQDVSALINSQAESRVLLRGTDKELNLRDGKNEVVVNVNGHNSNPYVFKQLIPSLAKVNPSATDNRPRVEINSAVYLSSRYGTGLGIFYKAIQEIRGAQDLRTEVKVFINGQDMTKRIAAGSQGYISIKGDAKQLNIHNGTNEVSIIVKGITSNTYIFQAEIE